MNVLLSLAITAAMPLALTLAATGDEKIDPKRAKSAYEFTVHDIDGETVDLKKYEGKVAVVVNVASRCGYTKSNYEALEKLYREYKDKGVAILAFPANNFGGQEPGSNEEIKSFCSDKHDVTFDLFSKVSVKGTDKAPLFQFLTKKGGDIGWNFEKFVLNKKGEVIGRFKSGVLPTDAKVRELIDKALAEG